MIFYSHENREKLSQTSPCKLLGKQTINCSFKMSDLGSRFAPTTKSNFLGESRKCVFESLSLSCGGDGAGSLPISAGPIRKEG